MTAKLTSATTVQVVKSGRRRNVRRQHKKKSNNLAVRDPRGLAFDGVSNKKKTESVQERHTMERGEVMARQKRRILAAQSNGLGPILYECAINDLNRDHSYLWKLKTSSATFGGIMAPWVDEDRYSYIFMKQWI